MDAPGASQEALAVDVGAPLAVAAALASQARPGRVAVRNARAATATRGSRLRTPLRGDEGYRDENAGVSIHLSL